MECPDPQVFGRSNLCSYYINLGMRPNMGLPAFVDYILVCIMLSSNTLEFDLKPVLNH